MCYSAEVWAEYTKYVQAFGAEVSIQEFYNLVYRIHAGEKLKAPLAMLRDLKQHPLPGKDGQAIARMVGEIFAREETAMQQELFKQQKRVNDAERKLKVKETLTALNDVRVGTDKVETLKAKLNDIQRTEAKPRDERIFPLTYAPVLTMEDGKRVLRPMRYQIRPPGAPPSVDFDKNRNGTYNARRDNLTRFWKKQFGHTHGLVVVDRFYENVEINGKNERLRFTPRTGAPMYVACLWAEWTDPKGKEPDVLGFAAITDEPEAEVLAAGHDRTIINLKRENIDTWLQQDASNTDELFALFDDKQHPYYEHQLSEAA